MKRIIPLLCIAIITAAIHAVPAALPADSFIGEWEGSMDEYNFNIVFMYSNTCIITVKNTRDGGEVTEDANGTWSCDENIIRINGNFPRSNIKGLKQIKWKSVYTFNNGEKSAFSMLVAPPGSNTQTRISFERIMRWIDE